MSRLTARRGRIHRVGTGLAAFAAVCTVLGVSAASATPAVQPKKAPASTPAARGSNEHTAPRALAADSSNDLLPTDVNAAAPAAEAVDPLGQRDFPDTYAGVYLTDNGNALNIQLTARTPSVEATLRAAALAAAPGVPVTFVTSKITLAELTALQARVTAAEPSLLSQDVNLVVWGANHVLGAVEITVYGLTASKAATLHAMFGPNIALSDSAHPTIIPFAANTVPR